MTAYLDNAATTRLHPDVKREMGRALESFGNPSSLHAAGRQARRLLEDSRESVAEILGADPKEIVFTSGATEANNLAIFGTGRRHIVTTVIEHPSVLEPCGVLERKGVRVTRIPCDATGRVEPAKVLGAIDSETALVSVMLANNEVGTLQPVAEIAAAARARGVLVHCDAAQACGKVRLRVAELGVDLLTLSAHKMHGPRGSGVFYVRKGTPLEPMIHGGGQEFERRAGTENVAAAVGFATALRIAEREFEHNIRHMERLRTKLVDGLAGLGDVHVNGHPAERLPSILNLTFDFVDGEAVILTLDAEGVCVSSGSACASLSMEPSHVLKAMGLSDDRARGSVRFSVAADTADADVDHALRAVPKVVERLRKISAAGHER